jgi:hypothetical protein
MDNNKLCIVDTVNFSIYDFADNQEQAEAKLIKAIESNKKDIATWENHCKNYPDVDSFKAYLKQAQNKKYEIMTFEEFLQRERNYYINQPITEITAEKYEEMLNILPPLKWCTIGNIEMFCMSEFLTGSYTSQYLHDRITNKYYHKIVDITDKATWGYNFIQR